MTVHILGNGGHGRDLADIVRAAGAVPSMHDDDPAKGPPLPPDAHYLLGFVPPRQRADRDEFRNTPEAFVHPSAVTSKGTVPWALKAGVVIGAGTTLGPDVTLGRHTHVGAGCTITRTTIGDYCQIAPGVDIAGDVTIGDRVFIGVGATVRNLVSIGDDVTVGAGAVVLHDVPDGYTVAGIPAKVIHRRVAA